MPRWDYTIYLGDVFHNDDLTFEERRDEIARRLLASGWLTQTDEDNVPGLTYLIEELGEAEDKDEFDEVWDAIYDEADADRVWIETISAR